MLEDVHIYGETEANDCPIRTDCYCPTKTGFWSAGTNHGGQDAHITSSSMFPMYNIKSYGAWKADTHFKRIHFHNYPRNFTECGAPTYIFALNPKASDFIPTQFFEGVHFDNVNDDAMAFFYDPPEKWNNIEDCIGFPCTAPSNAIFNFVKAKYSGDKRPRNLAREFSIIADTPGASETIPGCEFQEPWNAWHCETDYLGQLVFNALDEDSEDRNVAPVYVTNEETGYTNKLQHMMDHMWDGFYTGQKHKQQYIAMLDTREQEYTIEYTSTPFKTMDYELRATRGIIKVKVFYWTADGSYEVYRDGNLVEANAFDKDIGAAAEISMYRGCGENRYVGVSNYLEFVLTPYCHLQIRPVDKILTNVRMDWTIDEFWDNGGTTSFVDRVAGALGIHASQFKVVAVYEGSVVVDYEITPDTSSGTSSSAALSALTSSLNALTSGDDAGDIFGAPVLSASTGGASVVEDPTYASAGGKPAENQIVITQPTKPVEDLEDVQLGAEAEEEGPTTYTLYVGSDTIEINEETRNGLIAVLVVMVLIIGCCFAQGTVIICVYQISKNAKQAVDARAKHLKHQEAKKNGQADNSVSQVEIDEQYVLPDQIDLDIFTKKRESKFNKDNLNASDSKSGSNSDLDQSSRNSILEHSTRKLVDVKGKGKKGATPIQKDIVVAAKLNSLNRQSQDQALDKNQE